MQALLSRWPNTPKVELITTDGFLFPNAELEQRRPDGSQGLSRELRQRQRSYDFFRTSKPGRGHVEAPVYSHLTYDFVPDEAVSVDRPDILIVEGVNVLLPSRLPRDGKETPFVSDFFDFSVYLHADEDQLEKWYVARFMRLRSTAFRDPRSYFRKYADISDPEAESIARDIWKRINLRNLHENILPTRARASLILTKGPSHRIEEVALRKL